MNIPREGRSHHVKVIAKRTQKNDNVCAFSPKSSNLSEQIQFAGKPVALVREAEVQEHLSLQEAILDSRAALEDLGRDEAVNCVRTRVESRDRESAWLHTLRAGMPKRGVAGGKDYTSLKFDTPAMWVTVVDLKSGLPIAFVEANYLSRVRTAAVTAIATDLLAPPNPNCLAHFGVGKISELLVKGVLKVRPSIQKVFLVRHSTSNRAPDWVHELEGQVQIGVVERDRALIESDLVTTATNSREPVIPPHAAMPHVRHINLIGSNHLKRNEISDDLARRCLPPNGYLVVDDKQQANLEAGDFARLVESGELRWHQVPTLAEILIDTEKEKKFSNTPLTAFKSVGIGLMDLAVATGVLRRLGLLH
jgi:ornithine cyclodeaminase/alanine dehydrogenase-like protein (mu-crystallin family)